MAKHTSKKNKKKNVMYISFAFILLIALVSGGLYFYLINNTTIQQSTFPSQCTLQNNGIAYSTYKCPSTASTCDVTLKVDCNQQTSQQKVTFRTNGDWIAWDVDNDGSLNCFSVHSNPSPSCNIAYSNNILIPLNSPIISGSTLYGSVATIFTKKIVSSQYCAENRLLAGGGCELSTSPVLNKGYYEITSGSQSTFQCEQSYSGSQSGNILYSSNKAGSTSKTFSLSSGQTLTWTGSYSNQINYKEITQKVSQCTQDTVDSSNPNVYYICTADINGCGTLSTIKSFCPSQQVYDMNQQKCTPAYAISLTLNKNLVSSQDSVTGSVKISQTTQVSNIPVKIALINNLGKEITSITINTDSVGSKSFNLGTVKDVGDYQVTATFLHTLGEQSISKSLSVRNPIFITLIPDPTNIQYTSEDIKARALVKGLNNEDLTVTKWDFSGTVCGSEDLSKKVVAQLTKLGEYELYIPVNTPCTLILKAIGFDSSGLPSTADSISITVKQASVIIKSDYGNVQDKDAGTYTINFQTLDVNLNPIDTNNIITITTGTNACVSGSGKVCSSTNSPLPAVIVNRKDIGSYSFTYNFPEGGLSLIHIDSTTTSATSGILKNTADYSVNLNRPAGDIGGGPGGGGGGISYFWIIILTIGITSIIIIILILIRRKKGSNSYSNVQI